VNSVATTIAPGLDTAIDDVAGCRAQLSPEASPVKRLFAAPLPAGVLDRDVPVEIEGASRGADGASNSGRRVVRATKRVPIRGQGAGAGRVLGAAAVLALLAGGCAGWGTQVSAPEAKPATAFVPARDTSAAASDVAAGKQEDTEGNRQWTIGAVRGTVSSVRRDGGVMIRVFIGRKPVDFLVPRDSPKAAQLAGIVGSTVEAEGRMEFGKAGERILFATEVTEVAVK
jgi:hypothetical protein